MSEADAHIQDADILKMSIQEQHESKPLIRFACELPSGRKLHSEWLDPGKRREAVQAWLGAVRSEIVADESEARLRAKAKAALAAAEQQESIHQPTVHSAAPPASSSMPARPITTAERASSSAPSVPSLSTDPNVFVRQAVVAAEQAVAYWRAESAKAIAELQAAEAALKKWRAIALSLGVPTSEVFDGAGVPVEPAGGMQQSDGSES